jgi:ribosomal protein S27E
LPSKNQSALGKNKVIESNNIPRVEELYMSVTQTLAALQHQATSIPSELLKMNQESQIQIIRCPNCGNHAERHYIFSSNVTRTECDKCDYLMVTDTTSGRVIEAYAPGIYPHRLM